MSSSRRQRSGGRHGPSLHPAATPTFVILTILIGLLAAAKHLRGDFVSTAPSSSKMADTPCLYRKLSDLSPTELRPAKGKRHTTDPPSDAPGTVSLVCCRTTAGPMSVTVHETWSPFGSARFLAMVKDGYFSTRVPFFRCIAGWICQFGIAGTASVDKRWRDDNLKDDPQWLPQGPQHRQNGEGVKRFARGYLAYAGSGPNTRSNQFFVSLSDDESLGGGSPWEVPWGELVGKESFRALKRIYTAYGDGKAAPSQDELHERGGNSRFVRDGWPKLDYIYDCEVLDEV